MLLAYSFKTYVTFFARNDFYGFYNHLFKIVLNFPGLNRRRQRNPRQQIFRTLNVTSFVVLLFLLLLFVFYFKTGHSRSFGTFSFLLKIMKHYLTKTLFSVKVFHGLSENIMEDVKLMPDNVLKISLQYLPSSLSYQEYRRVGNAPPPPPVQRFLIFPPAMPNTKAGSFV